MESKNESGLGYDTSLNITLVTYIVQKFMGVSLSTGSGTSF